MKKSFRILLTAFYALLCVTSTAQPVFTYAVFAPHNGDTYTVGRSAGPPPGPSGAAQNWDFSASSISSTATYTVNAASTVSCYANYPSATQAIGTGGAYDMISVGTGDYEYYGTTLSPSMPNVIFSDAQKIYVYPMHFNDHFSDGFFGVNDSEFYEFGTASVTYDAYGTLKTPYGTYTNVLRLHTQKTFTDSVSGGLSCTGSRDDYYWYVSTYPYPVARIWNSPGACNPSSGAEFLQSMTVGVPEIASEEVFKVGPTVFTNQLVIVSGKNSSEKMVVYDLQGQAIRTFTIAAGSSTIHLGELENGVYLLRFGNGQTVKVIRQ